MTVSIIRSGRRTLTAMVGLAALAFIAMPASHQPAMAKSKNAVVVELFTSQGCSSCPPADKYLGELTQNEDVIALTLPVDYWDYLGWKDTFASPAYSERQRDYARRRGDRSVYTPQMVLNGRIHAVGSDRRNVSRLVKDFAKAKSRSRVDVTFDVTGDTVHVKADGRTDASAASRGTIWLMLVSAKETVEIRRGENTGRSIAYHNVVRQMVPIGTWTGKPVNIALPKSDLMEKNYDACIVLIQEDNAGPIIGAAQVTSAELN